MYIGINLVLLLLRLIVIRGLGLRDKVEELIAAALTGLSWVFVWFCLILPFFKHYLGLSFLIYFLKCLVLRDVFIHNDEHMVCAA